MKIELTRTFIYTILFGIFLSTNFHSQDMPEAIPIDFGESIEDGGMRSCTDCNINYNPNLMGASCCDEAIALDPLLTCEILETAYYWNCSGCTCTEWDNGGPGGTDYTWETDFGCTDQTACNYQDYFIWNDGSCYYETSDCTCTDVQDILDTGTDNANCVQDCAGVWGGSSVMGDYYLDSDFDGMGSGSSTSYCNTLVPFGWVSNDNDACPNDFNNDIDGDGDCGDVDNCPDDANSNQLDTDADGEGDVCDLDDDADGCPDDDDDDPLIDGPDFDSDGIDDDCDDDDDDDGALDDADSDDLMCIYAVMMMAITVMIVQLLAMIHLAMVLIPIVMVSVIQVIQMMIMMAV